MDELKRKANPTVKLLRITEELHKEQVITNNLICRLCDIEEERLAEDSVFREAWGYAKRKDERVSKVVVALGILGVALAVLALYHDVINIDPILIQHVSNYMDTLL